MPDNIIEDAPNSDAVKSDATPAAPEATSQPETQPKHVRLTESALESSMSDVLPLSPIGGVEPLAGVQNEKKTSERRGLRRGNGSSNKPKTGNPSSSVGVIENPAEVTETLSGSRPKPREHREREPRDNNRFNRRNEANSIRKDDNVSAETAEPANTASAAKVNEVKPGSGWAIQEKKERNFHHIQSNVNGNARPKLIIEPSPIPEQEAEPTFWERLKARILAFFKTGKKKDKKRGNKHHSGKFRNDNRRNGGKDFRYSNNRNGGKQNFNRNRPRNGGNFRNGNRGNGRPHGNGSGNTPAA